MQEAEDDTDPGEHERPAVVVDARGAQRPLVRDIESGHEVASAQEVTLAVEQRNGHDEAYACKKNFVKGIL